MMVYVHTIVYAEQVYVLVEPDDSAWGYRVPGYRTLRGALIELRQRFLMHRRIYTEWQAAVYFVSSDIADYIQYQALDSGQSQINIERFEFEVDSHYLVLYCIPVVMEKMNQPYQYSWRQLAEFMLD